MIDLESACGTLWRSGSVHDLQARHRRFESLAGLNLLRRCAPGQGLHPHVHSYDPGEMGTSFRTETVDADDYLSAPQ